jgi:hypothetical protein
MSDSVTFADRVRTAERFFPFVDFAITITLTLALRKPRAAHRP